MSSSVRVDDDTKDRLNQIAEDEDRPMSRIVANALDVYEQMKLAKISRPVPLLEGKAASDTGGMGAPVENAAPVASVCPHPDSERKVRSWGAICGACGTVMR